MSVCRNRQAAWQPAFLTGPLHWQLGPFRTTSHVTHCRHFLTAHSLRSFLHAWLFIALRARLSSQEDIGETCVSGARGRTVWCLIVAALFWACNKVLQCGRTSPSYTYNQNRKHCGHDASTISKLIGKHNSRYFWKQFIIASDVRLGGYVNTVCVAVVCNFDQGKKETERLLVGERESWEGRGGERVTEWAEERESQAAAETQRYRLKKHRKMKGAETWEQVRGGWNSNTEEKKTEKWGNSSKI